MPKGARVIELRRAVLFALELLENLWEAAEAGEPVPPQSRLHYSEALGGYVRPDALPDAYPDEDEEGDASFDLAIGSASQGRAVFYACMAEHPCQKIIRHFCHAAGVRESQAPNIVRMGFGPVTLITCAANELAGLPIYCAHPFALSLAELERLTEFAVREHAVTMLVVDERKRDGTKPYWARVEKLPPKLRTLLEAPPARSRDDEINAEILRRKVELIAHRLEISRYAVFV